MIYILNHDRLFGIVVSTLTAIQEVPSSIPCYTFGSIGSGTESSQPREDNLAAT